MLQVSCQITRLALPLIKSLLWAGVLPTPVNGRYN